MKDLIGQMVLPFLSWLLLIVPIAAAQTANPAPMKPFSLPLTTGESATAVLLPIDDGRMWMVYATPDGKIGFWMMSQSTDPIPPDPIPPPPPEPTRLTIVAVEDPERTTQRERDVLADAGWRGLAMEKHNFMGIIPVDLIDKRTGKPPPLFLPFMDLAKGKKLPWVILGDDQGNVLWQGSLPDSPAEFTTLIEKYGG